MSQSRAKFHAFLKKCESRPECGRQTLQQLLINPVQRLPRYSLLLKEILRVTDDKNPDKADLKEAIEKIAEVLTHINEDKRKTEDIVAMFEIVNDIEGAPSLLSAQRDTSASKSTPNSSSLKTVTPSFTRDTLSASSCSMTALRFVRPFKHVCILTAGCPADLQEEDSKEE